MSFPAIYRNLFSTQQFWKSRENLQYRPEPSRKVLTKKISVETAPRSTSTHISFQCDIKRKFVFSDVDSVNSRNSQSKNMDCEVSLASAINDGKTELFWSCRALFECLQTWKTELSRIVVSVLILFKAEIGGLQIKSLEYQKLWLHYKWKSNIKMF